VIFATVGTHQDGFPRLLRALETLPAGDLVVQYGHGAPPSNAMVAEAFMPFSRVAAYVEQAEAVVTHAGVGSILVAVGQGHVPVVVPRLRRHGEHVDDHQAELAECLAAAGRVLVVRDTDRLAAAVRDAAERRAAPSPLPQTGLHRAVRAAVRGGGAAPSELLGGVA
jgi:UDP-N-acetylglucosamine--N-acetylmuramyl-(pentapeptide) pyrophosphoryl-undecaprenol N-acetylglucosamine transferase